jgi:lipoprotein-anchoring transpeptidase ErfK/SrfK
VQLYYEVTAPKGPAYNPLWYRVWNGYVHSAYIQKVKFRYNPVMTSFPEAGVLCELTVPFTNSYRYRASLGWERLYRLYYQTTHWVIGADPGPDGRTWYKIEGAGGLTYHAPAEHFRPFSDAEVAPLSVDVPPEEKRIEVAISSQTLTAYEGKEIVYQTNVSTGLPIKPDPNGIPWATPKGTFYIATKLPSQHMGEGNLTGDPDAYELPGVPWTVYFEPVTGVAFHGAYWHSNFGMQMSHGCVNMRPDDARWLFRWTTPAYNVPVLDKKNRERRGRGTRVDVI